MNKYSILFSLFFLIILCQGIFAEVFFFDTGRIVIGDIENKSDSQITIKSGNDRFVVNLKTIVRTENDINSLIGTELTILLDDRSVVEGQLVDIDQDLGLFLKMSVGILNLPFAVIKEIMVKENWTVSSDSATNIGLGFYLMQPLNSEILGLGYVPRLALEAKIPGVHGLTVGETIDYYFMTYLPSEEVRYRLASVTINLTANIIPFLTQKPSTFFLAPYLRIGAGALFVAVVDDRPDAKNTNYGTINAQIRAELGTGFVLSPHFAITLDASIQGIFQYDGPFWSLGGGISVQYRL